MSYIVAANSAFPPHYYSQQELTDVLLSNMANTAINHKIIHKIHRSVNVSGRHLALPKEVYPQLPTFSQRNSAYGEVALSLAHRCVAGLFEKAGFAAKDLSQMIFTTVTGIAVPSIDARLINKLHLSPQLKRVPLFGLGCVAGAAGIARAHDYLVGNPFDSVVLLSVELCSLTVQMQDDSMANIVASGLFGDGCAAVLMRGSAYGQSGKARVIDSESVFFPQTERVMGWDIVNDGFKIVLSAEVPHLAQNVLPSYVNTFLAKHSLRIEDIDRFIAHPGGPKVIDALEKGLNLKAGALDLSRENLRKNGNLSSSSVLCVLQDEMNKDHAKDSYGLMLAMGPGFCAEMVLLQW